MNTAKQQNFLGYVLVLPAMLASVLLFLAPYAYTVYLSFFNVNLSRGSNQYIGLRNYIDFFSKGESQKILLNSAIFVFTLLPLIVLAAFILASLMQKDFRGKRVYRTINILPWVVSSTCAAFMFNWLFDESTGLINVLIKTLGMDGVRWLSDANTAFAVAMLLVLWKSVPFSFMILLSGLQGIPTDYYEAVEMDGGGYFAKLRAITLPSLVGQFKIIFVCVTLGLLNTADVLHALGGTVTSMKVIGYSVFTEAFHSLNISKAAAISVIMLVLNLAFSLTYMKLFRLSKQGDDLL